ncbi:MAG: hypothetical protein HRU35_03465 [Rickettsiaceae bacterium]|nr:hypothetical protein [Rickettsiaceae bacterium]
MITPLNYTLGNRNDYIDNRLKQDKDFTKFKFKKEDFDQLLKKKKIVKMSNSRYR